ncbi:hypothetical protein M569_14742, partial [Genlisea aurea]
VSRSPENDFPLRCSVENSSEICSGNHYPSKSVYPEIGGNGSSPVCPDYFRWIHEDLRPWRKTGITEEMVAASARGAHFRIVIIDGKLHLKTYKKSFQTRDRFTIWGFLQLLRRYPGEIPNLDLVFNCDDTPAAIEKRTPLNSPPPPVFRYCGDNTSANIVFPDWSFWGWAELNIKPWQKLSPELEAANRRTRWSEREPYAYWKGNPRVSISRTELMKCNVSDRRDWKARLYSQNWTREIKQGFKESDLTTQCTHRYKIYIEGIGWSVSDKYILACDSLTLLVHPRYFDFFTRSLKPLKHYWPVNNTCRSIQSAVEWGNAHQKQARAMGASGSRFVLDELKMDYVYDYMFHSLNEYAKLLSYEPDRAGFVEICSESIACNADGLMREFFVDSMVRRPSLSPPCSIP